MATSKLFLVPCLLSAIFLLGWGTSRLSFNEPSLAALQSQILLLQRDLRGFDKMKEEYVREEIEIIWDKQHLLELDDQQSELNTNLSHLTQSFKQEASALRDDQRQTNRALSALHESNDKVRSQDIEVLSRLDEESGKAHEKKYEEHQQHVVLEDILGEMRQLLDIQRSGLRGASKSLDSYFLFETYVASISVAIVILIIYKNYYIKNSTYKEIAGTR